MKSLFVNEIKKDIEKRKDEDSSKLYDPNLLFIPKDKKKETDPDEEAVDYKLSPIETKEKTELTAKSKFNKKKIYHVFLDKSLKEGDRLAILKGMKLDEDFIQPDALDFVDPSDKTQVGIEIHTGQNRIIRRTFESLGYRIRKLDRVYFAGLTKKGLQRGQWRFLSEKEVGILKMMAFE